jgi:hypothetical protein
MTARKASDCSAGTPGRLAHVVVRNQTTLTPVESRADQK